MDKQQQVLHHYRECIRLYDEDRTESGYQYRFAYGMSGPWRTYAFDMLEQEILKIIRAFTPNKRGHYKTTHVSIGYSSLPVSRWVDDKVQPPRQTVDDALAKFDKLVESWNTKATQRLA